MQPTQGQPVSRPISTGGIADPEIRRVIDAQAREIQQLKREMAALRRSPPWDSVDIDVLTELSGGGLTGRRITFRDGLPPQLGASRSVGTVAATGGGDTVTINNTGDVINNSYTTSLAGSVVINPGSLSDVEE